MGIAENIINIKKGLAENVRLVAVSKTKPVSNLLEAYGAGQRVFGENKVQELTDKQEQMPADVEWHFIGHLQTNKVKYIVPFVSLIHSVDSFKLLKTVDKEGRKNERIVKCLLQFHIAEEETKFGFDLDEARGMLSSAEFRELEFVEICGVMGMATNTANKQQIRKEFRFLKHIFGQLNGDFFKGKETFREISMGMSGDYLIAVEEGSTLVRVGSLIFGERSYGIKG